MIVAVVVGVVVLFVVLFSLLSFLLLIAVVVVDVFVVFVKDFVEHDRIPPLPCHVYKMVETEFQNRD